MNEARTNQPLTFTRLSQGVLRGARHAPRRLGSYLLNWPDGSLICALAAGFSFAALTSGLRLPICWLMFRFRLVGLLQLLYPFFWLLVISALGGTILGVCLLLFRRYRAFAVRILLAAPVYVAASVWFAVLAHRLYFHEAGRIPARTKELVAAIRAFDAAHGNPPASLDALVPEYIERVPFPSGGTRYEYFVGVARDGFLESPWGLIIELPGIYVWIGEDRLVYLSDGNYGERADVVDGWEREIWD